LCFASRPTVIAADPSALFLLGLSYSGVQSGIGVLTASNPGSLQAHLRAVPAGTLLLANPALWVADGWRCLAELQKRHPRHRIGVLVDEPVRWDIERIVHAGYHAYVGKRSLTQRMLPDMIRTMLGGGIFVATDCDTRTEALSLRELEVLRLLRDGRSVSEIAHRLFLGERTVKATIMSAVQNLGAVNRVHAIALAYEHGLLPPRC
jgi:DNA-binding NarL/FixJ family response regulator